MKIPRFTLRQLVSTFLAILLVICIFAGLDYIAHSFSAEYAVPSYYFRNKIIFGTLIAFITNLIVAQKSLRTRALIVAAVTCILLQTRYALEGYPMDFVVLFLFIHFAILVPTYLGVFHFMPKQ